MANENLLERVADIVAAHVSRNVVPVNDMPELIRSVFGSLSMLGRQPEAVREERLPAVSIRSSIKPDAIVCLECGAKKKMLKRHISSEHSLTPDEYRARWKLPLDYPLVAPSHSSLRKDLAVKNGLGRRDAEALASTEAMGPGETEISFETSRPVMPEEKGTS